MVEVKKRLVLSEGFFDEQLNEKSLIKANELYHKIDKSLIEFSRLFIFCYQIVQVKEEKADELLSFFGNFEMFCELVEDYERRIWLNERVLKKIQEIMKGKRLFMWEVIERANESYGLFTKRTGNVFFSTVLDVEKLKEKHGIT